MLRRGTSGIINRSSFKTKPEYDFSKTYKPLLVIKGLDINYAKCQVTVFTVRAGKRPCRSNEANESELIPGRPARMAIKSKTGRATRRFPPPTATETLLLLPSHAHRCTKPRRVRHRGAGTSTASPADGHGRCRASGRMNRSALQARQLRSLHLQKPESGDVSLAACSQHSAAEF